MNKKDTIKAIEGVIEKSNVGIRLIIDCGTSDIYKEIKNKWVKELANALAMMIEYLDKEGLIDD